MSDATLAKWSAREQKRQRRKRKREENKAALFASHSPGGDQNTDSSVASTSYSKHSSLDERNTMELEQKTLEGPRRALYKIAADPVCHSTGSSIIPRPAFTNAGSTYKNETRKNPAAATKKSNDSSTTGHKKTVNGHFGQTRSFASFPTSPLLSQPSPSSHQTSVETTRHSMFQDEEELDLVAEARRLEERNNKESRGESCKNPPSSPAPTKTKTPVMKLDLDEECSLVALSKSLEEKRIMEGARKNRETCDHGAPTKSHQEENKSSAFGKQLPVVHYSLEELGSLAETARQLEKRKKSNNTRKSLSSKEHDNGFPKQNQRVPHNPLTLQREHVFFARNHSFENVEKKASSDRSMSRLSDTTDDLWDDSRDDIDGFISENIERASAGKDEDQEGGRKKRIAPTKRIIRGSSCLVTWSSSNAKVSDSDEDDCPPGKEKLMPEFENPKLGPPTALEPLVLSHNMPESSSTAVVPAAVNRYLQYYQREGVQFLYNAISQGKGVILGDDMGLGKTVQIISLLAALLGKAGTSADKLAIKKRRRKHNKAREEDNAPGETTKQSPGTPSNHEQSPNYDPIIIIVPSSVVDNWVDEFQTWGHFAVIKYQDINRTDKTRFDALCRVRDGLEEILVCPKSLFSRLADFESIKEVKWKLVVVDEFHEFKNEKTGAFNCLEELRQKIGCPIVGLTGTAMQNRHRELFNLISLVQPDLLRDRRWFDDYFGKPLQHMRIKTVSSDAVQLGHKRQQELLAALEQVYLQRKKEDVLKETLTDKNEKVLFCPLSDLQKRVYKRILSLPEVMLVREANCPCDCGVNRSFFLAYRRLRSRKEQIQYQRVHKNEIMPRKECCYQVPTVSPNSSDINPDAVLWRSQHPSLTACTKCPFCILLPVFAKLYKVSSHLSLLQVDRAEEEIKKEANLAFAKAVFAGDLSGQSFYRDDSIMDDHLLLSGKMVVLDQCLRKFTKKRDRALIFSCSTETLDLIARHVQSRGYRHLRLDGRTPTKYRQKLVEEFQNDESIFLFLISTGAGALGLNLTAANKVIIFDVNWNPSSDEQAQDRAFRIGQQRDVDVIRLVSQGTIEELKYIRQIYKLQLKQDALGGMSNSSAQHSARLFRGVEGDKDRKGELFGAENLLKFKYGSFMADLWKSYDSSNMTNVGSLQIYGKSDVANVLNGMTEEAVEALVPQDDTWSQPYTDRASVQRPSLDTTPIASLDAPLPVAVDHHSFLREDRGTALLKPGDEGFDEEMGGLSQTVLVILEKEKKHLESLEAALTANEENEVFAKEANRNEEGKKSFSRIARKLNSPGAQVKNSATSNGSEEDPSSLSILHDARPVAKFKSSRSLRVALMGVAPKDATEAKLDFTALDLHVPSYNLTPRKRKEMD